MACMSNGGSSISKLGSTSDLVFTLVTGGTSAETRGGASILGMSGGDHELSAFHGSGIIVCDCKGPP